jgi:exonuclease III
MAFRRKAAVILRHKPDILVVPECEHPDNLNFREGVKQPSQVLWVGNNRHKGLGIFSYGKYHLKLRRNYHAGIQTVVPVAVSGSDYDFTLYAIWAWNPSDPDGRYVEQIWKALHHYDRHLTNKPVILAGDFNSNSIWDKKYRIGNHSHVVERLASKKIYSTYHLHHKQEQGREKHPTLYMYRHKNKPYHIDYCFVSAGIAGKLESVKIGRHKYWTQYSDHVPVIVTFK